MKVVAINDKNRPNEIPANKWIKKGEEYTVTKVMKLNIQGGIYGYQLAEIDISMYSPYEYFAAYRFAVIAPSTKKIEEEELMEAA